MTVSWDMWQALKTWLEEYDDGFNDHNLSEVKDKMAEIEETF